MDFGFNEEQREVQQLARKILSEQVTPEKLARYDEYLQDAFDRELWGQLAGAGLLGVATREAWGGMGFGFTELALFIEEIGRNIAPVPAIPCLVSAALPLQRFGSQAQQQRLLPGVASGEHILTAALMEENNEDPAQPRLTTAVVQDGGWRVNGVKWCVPHARDAGRILLSARVEGGVVVLLVDPAAAGVSLEPMRVTNFEPQYRLELSDVLVSADDVLVAPEAGAAVMQWLTERTMAATHSFCMSGPAGARSARASKPIWMRPRRATDC